MLQRSSRHKSAAEGTTLLQPCGLLSSFAAAFCSTFCAADLAGASSAQPLLLLLLPLPTSSDNLASATAEATGTAAKVDRVAASLSSHGRGDIGPTRLPSAMVGGGDLLSARASGLQGCARCWALRFFFFLTTLASAEGSEGLPEATLTLTSSLDCSADSAKSPEAGSTLSSSVDAD